MSKSFLPTAVFSTLIVLVVPTVLAELIGQKSLNGQALCATESPRTCFKLEQHSKISGDTEIFIDATCLKLRFKRSHNVIFAKAPDWSTYKYNLATKRYCIVPVGKFTNTVSVPRRMLNQITFSDVALQKNAPRPYGKFMEMVYSTGSDHSTKAWKLYKKRDVTGDYPSSMKTGGLITDNCAKEEIKLLRSIYALPAIAEIPLEASSIGLDCKSHVYLSTESVEEIPVTASTFAEPSNFKKVDSESQVSEDTEFNENFLDFMNNESRTR